MATTEGLKPVSNETVPIDPNVRVPDHVRAASAAAEELYKRAYPVEATEKPADPVAAAPVEPVQPVQPVTAAATEQPLQQVPPHEVPLQPLKPGEENVTAEEWRHRFLSMQGRYNGAQRNVGSMEEQMRQLAEENVRLHSMLAQGAPQAQPQAAVNPNHGNLITDKDREDYGEELIDLSRRAAREAVAPELEQLRAENQRLTQRVQSTGKRELFATLDRSIPSWRAVNDSVQFKAWLRLPNVYTGRVRTQMLKEAVDGAEAPKVIALFRDFLTEAQATGQMAPTLPAEQQVPAPAPRTPAVALETLAAPGRARPASGDSQVPVEKPIITRAEISKFYDDSRKGLYAGREAEYAQRQADLQSAQREGRIR